MEVKRRLIRIITLSMLISSLISITGFGKTCYVGDSRTVGMNQTVGDRNALWKCKVGEGHHYLVYQCLPFIYRHREDIDTVVFLFGVNDLYNCAKYVRTINDFAETTDAKVYFVSVNPVVDKQSKYVQNRDIVSFNDYCKTHLSDRVTYIDTNSNISFTTTDGIHYNKNTYEEIFRFIEKYTK